MPTLLYLDSARMGLMSERALLAHGDYLRLAAEQGDLWSQVDLGYMYLNGEGVPKDLVEASKWLRLAAENSDDLGPAMSVTRSNAQAQIGIMEQPKRITTTCINQ